MADLARWASEHHILIVDDEPGFLEEVTESLRAAGWRVECASNASTALEKLNADRNLTVLLSDLKMPGADGLTLARRVCDRWAASNPTEVVLLTADGTDADIAEAARIGVFDFLAKPISLKLLLDSTERAYQSARDRRLRVAASHGSSSRL